MKSGLKNGWPSVVRLRLRDKSVTPFCIFSKVKSAGNIPGNTPVYLNVYDLTTVNGYMYWAGIGIFHSGVEGQLTVKTFPNISKKFSLHFIQRYVPRVLVQSCFYLCNLSWGLHPIFHKKWFLIVYHMII